MIVPINLKIESKCVIESRKCLFKKMDWFYSLTNWKSQDVFSYVEHSGNLSIGQSSLEHLSENLGLTKSSDRMVQVDVM